MDPAETEKTVETDLDVLKGINKDMERIMYVGVKLV